MGSIYIVEHVEFNMVIEISYVHKINFKINDWAKANIDN